MTNKETDWIKEIRDNTKQLKRIVDKLDVIARLITDRKTEPATEEPPERQYDAPWGMCIDEHDDYDPRSCETCKHDKLEWDSDKCDSCCKAHSNYEPGYLVTEYPQKGEVRLIGTEAVDAVIMDYGEYKKMTREPRKILEDGMLCVNVNDYFKVKRVLVQDKSHWGGLFYRDDEPESRDPVEDKPTLSETEPAGMSNYINKDILKKNIISRLGIRSPEYLLPGEKIIFDEIDSASSIDVPMLISCSERLPEIGEDNISGPCIVFCENGVYGFAEFTEKGWSCESGDEFHEPLGKVKAWMLLPEYTGDI